MRQSTLRAACLLIAGFSLLAFAPARAGAQSSCTGGNCIDTYYYFEATVGCPDGCPGGVSSYDIIIPGESDGYGSSAQWFPNQWTETCCFSQTCMVGHPQSGCPIQVLRRDLKPDEVFALGLDMPFLFVRGCDGKYSMVSFLSAS